MALARRSSRPAEGYIWPGFVDGLATLLMVIIFVLMVFFLIQVSLTQRVSGQDETLKRLQGDIATLANLLNIERSENADLKLQNQQLTNSLSDQTQRIATLEAILGQVTERAETAERARDHALVQLEENQETITASQAEIAELTAAIETINDKLGQLQALLDEKEEEARLAKEANINLTEQLNNALSSKVLELQRFKSEFFGRVREALEGRSDIEIVGDRFVFQSEVLFAPGSADIGAEGERQLRELSIALLEIADTIPSDIDWVLQISGHTDNIPIKTTRFRDNWDLSTERALSVVRYFTLSGIDQKHLSAAGFGEFHPIDTANTPQGRAKNRRIEIKLTER